MPSKKERERVAEIVRDAGGQIVGRTRLQKVAYLLELTGLGSGFEFEYRHYGPYSESLFDAAQTANAFGLLIEEERTAKWGGHYSIYSITDSVDKSVDECRFNFASRAAQVGAVELELAATAAYLFAVEHFSDPWAETVRRKPEKAAEGRLEKAREAYRSLLEFHTPKPLPQIV